MLKENVNKNTFFMHTIYGGRYNVLKNDDKIKLMYIQKLLYLLDRLVSNDIFLDFMQQFKYSEKLCGRH